MTWKPIERTAAQTEAAKRIRKWCQASGLKLSDRKVHHVHAAAYVVGYAAPGCLVVAVCFAESERHLQKFDRENPLKTVRQFDRSLKAGDWCQCAYVCHAHGQEEVAIAISGSRS